MRLYDRIDFDELQRLVDIGAEEALGFAGEDGSDEVSRWGAAARDPAYLRRLAWHVCDLLCLGGAPADGFVLLDAGGGSGLLSVLACMMGASRAIVIDTNSHLMGFLTRFAPRLAPRIRIEGYLRDVSRTQLPSASIDLVLCNEALSHMIDLEAFMNEATRVLRPGGRLVISDSNNEANPGVRRARIRQWERFERAPRGGAEPGELFAKRCGLIAGRFPDAPRDLVTDIAAATFAMTGEAVMEAARRRLEGEPLVESFFDRSRCPVDPISDQCADRLFRPYELSRQMARHGFKTRVRAHFATVPPYRALNGVWGAMSPFTLPISRAFRIVAVKDHGP